jgi:predicted nuclease of predicted toxin-antitoxin system
LNFLADESLDFAVVRALREAGHDVLAVAEVAGGSADLDVIRLAGQGTRVLLTEDRDFGRLVFAHTHGSSGVLYIRFPATARSVLPAAAVDLVAHLGEQLLESFVVLQPGRARVSPRRP